MTILQEYFSLVDYKLVVDRARNSSAGNDHPPNARSSVEAEDDFDIDEGACRKTVQRGTAV